ncbi:MAG: acetoacetate decarboxylase family protein [bacterium]
MGFVRTLEQIAAGYRETADFYDAQMLFVFWETRPDIVQRLLPPPLEPAERPLAMAFVANYPRTNFGVAYLESALFLRARFQGEEGHYCLSMPVTNDIAMAGGREIYGYPKKIAEIGLTREGPAAHGWTERRGQRFFEVRARMSGELDDPAALGDLGAVFAPGMGNVVVAFNFKHFPAPEGLGFDYSPRLVREEVEFRPRSVELGQAEIVLRTAALDPWSEVEVVRVLGCAYIVSDNFMRKGKVVAETDPMAFAPYAFLKWDF